MLNYASLDEAKVELVASSAIDNDQLYNYTRIVSRRIDQLMTGRSRWFYFGPNQDTRKIVISNKFVDSRHNTLLLNRPLLELTGLTAVSTNVLSVAEGYPQGETPYYLVRITSNGDPWYSYLSDDCNPGYAQIAGIWGYHSDYANAWLSVDTLSANITASATSMTVADVDGDDAYGIANRLSAGHLVKIDSEFILIVTTTPGSNTATLKRGMLGTTAAAHSSGATVYRWETEEPIRRITARQASFLYARQGSFQAETLDGIGTIIYPQDLLNELARTLQEYM